MANRHLNAKPMVTVHGLDLLLDRLGNLRGGLHEEIAACCEEAADIIIGRAQSLMDEELNKGKWPYTPDGTEPARDAFVTVTEDMGDRVRIKVINENGHYIYLEMGTRSHSIEPQNEGGVLRFETPEGNILFADFIENVTGVPEFGFLQRAVKETRGEVQQLLKDNFNTYLQEGQRTVVRRRARRKAVRGKPTV